MLLKNVIGCGLCRWGHARAFSTSVLRQEQFFCHEKWNSVFLPWKVFLLDVIFFFNIEKNTYIQKSVCKFSINCWWCLQRKCEKTLKSWLKYGFFRGGLTQDSLLIRAWEPEPNVFGPVEPEPDLIEEKKTGAEASRSKKNGSRSRQKYAAPRRKKA